jgi:hypothetical protein
LDEELKEYNRHTTNIGKGLTTIAPFFKTYSRYCNNFDKSNECLAKLKKNVDFKAFLTNIDKDKRTTGLGLSSYLILPIQRKRFFKLKGIPRYRLLLQDLLKVTPVENMGYNELVNSLDKIKEVAAHLNETVRNLENSEEIKKIYESFNSKEKVLFLLEPHMKFIKDGFEEFYDSNENKKCFIHLFGDMIVYSHGKKDSFDFKEKIMLYNMKVYDYIPTQEKPKEEDFLKFQIKGSSEISLVAKSKEEKIKWMNMLYNTIVKLEISLKEKKYVKINLFNEVQDDSATTLALAISNDKGEFKISEKEAILKMKKGCTMLKYCRSSKPHFRRFLLQDNELSISWGSPNKSQIDSKVLLSSVKRLLIGQNTLLFSKYKNKDTESISFSLLYDNRTLDIVCKDKEEFITWCTGITYLLENPVTDKPHFPLGKEEKNDYSVFHHDIKLENKKFTETYARIGDLYTWGESSRGALGHGDEFKSDIDIPKVVRDFLYLDVEKAYCENSGCFILTNNGQVFSFGAGDDGRLGQGDEIDRNLPALVKAFQARKITSIGMGFSHTLALEDDDTVYSFGGNKYGQLGHGDNEKRSKPTKISFFNNKSVKFIS